MTHDDLIQALTPIKLEGVHQTERAAFTRLLESKGFQKLMAKLEPLAGGRESQHAFALRREELTSRAPSGPAPARRADMGSRGRHSRPVERSTAADGTLTKMHRAMLTALAQHPDGLSKKQILVHTGYASSGPVSAAFADLAREGWASSNGNRLHITDTGLQVLGPYDPLPVGDALREWLLAGDKLSTMERALLKVICAAFPDPIRRGEVLEQTGYASSGPVSAAFAKLVAYNYAVPQGPSMLRAAQELFS